MGDFARVLKLSLNASRTGGSRERLATFRLLRNVSAPPPRRASSLPPRVVGAEFLVI